MSRTIWVYFDTGASPEEVERLSAAFDAADLNAEVSSEPYSLVASGAPDIGDAFAIIATVSSTGFIGAFATKAGGDGYEALKSLISRIRRTRAHDSGKVDIILRGEESGPDIHIDANTLDGALGQLLLGELPDSPSGALYYDPAAGRWSDSDER